MKTRYHIGIDCGVKTGTAVWDAELKKFQSIATSHFWAIYEGIQMFKTEETKVWVEDPTQNKPVFPRNVEGFNVKMNIAQKVGMVKRETELFIQGIERLGFEVVRVRPQKGSYTKMKATAFKNLTKYEGRTSEHSRDAAMLVFQRG